MEKRRGVALVRSVSQRIADCELTHLERRPVNLARARAQHAEYVAALAAAGWEPVQLPALPACPDAVFVEDTAVVLDEVAVVTRPGAASRQPETETVEAELRKWRRTERVGSPATIDGGDVLCLGRSVFVGRTLRTSDEGIDALRRALAPFDYCVTGLEVRGALHLKTAVTPIGDDGIVVDARSVEPSAFGARWILEVDPREPEGANVLDLGSVVLVPASASRTAAALSRAGREVVRVAQDELAKAEAGLTCCSLLVGGV